MPDLNDTFDFSQTHSATAASYAYTDLTGIDDERSHKSQLTLSIGIRRSVTARLSLM